MNIALIFPHQLFQNSALLEQLNPSQDQVVLAEDYLFFRQAV